MLLVITSLELASPLKLLRMYGYTVGIVKQLRHSNCLSFKTYGWWRLHYTMSLWRNEKEMRNFSLGNQHLYAMRNARSVAKEVRTLRLDTDHMPGWAEARALLKVRGKVLRF
jgi:hypothetical protein